MRYIKLFENHTEYYFSVSQDEFENIQIVNFSYSDKLDSYIESLNGFRKNSDLTQFYKPCFIGEIEIYKRGLHKRNGFLSYKIETNNHCCFILESLDEWIYVNIEEEIKPFNNYFYKCDRFDGLVKLLKDKEVI